MRWWTLSKDTVNIVGTDRTFRSPASYITFTADDDDGFSFVVPSSEADFIVDALNAAERAKEPGIFIAKEDGMYCWNEQERVFEKLQPTP